MGILDSGPEEPRSKLRRYIITTSVFILLVVVGIWYLTRYRTEIKTVETFLSTLAAGNLERAHQLWQPPPSYPMEEFLRDWGPSSEFGPVKSYRVVGARMPDDASGVIVTVEVSPYDPLPEAGDPRHRQTKEVRLWVERRNQSLSFPP